MEEPESEDSIAIVGISCRLPGGVHCPADFWRVLSSGQDCIREVPAERWRHTSYYHPHADAPGTTVAREAGWVDGVYDFDAEFFGISPREAEAMDPQQRLMLELAVEALQAADWPLEQLAGSPTGVFVALSSYDLALHADAFGWDTHAATGASPALVSNRISYCLDLRGPSLTLDSACSASLTVLDVACRSLRAGQCQQALVGAVNLLLDPAFFLAFSRLHMLSPGNRSRAFDAAADGYVRGEGAVMFALKPWAAARRDGDRIEGRILASAVNQDGRTPGITAPNPSAQEALLRSLYACDQRRRRLAYVETHGTGTPLGDPIEARALSKVLAHPSRRLWIGSAKTQLGHLEGAAGAVGLLKGVLALQHGQVPPSLHFRQPPDGLDLEALGLAIPQSVQPLAPGSLVGVSSFGFGGTNAHVVLEGPEPEPPQSDQAEPAFHLVPLAAASAGALRQRARQCRELLRQGAALPRLARSLARHLQLPAQGPRQSFLASTGDQLAGLLEHWLEASVEPTWPLGGQPRPVMVFSGQGPQWWGMGRELLAFPVYREMIERCDDGLGELLGWSLLEVLGSGPHDSRLQQTLYAQPALFALQMGLVALWRSWGIEPAAVVGHSVGEIAAACCAHWLTLEQGLQVIAQRARTMEKASAQGRMAVVRCSLARARELLQGSDLEIGAVNAPDSLTLSGPASSLEGFLQQAAGWGLDVRPLDVHYAFHSALVEPVREPLLRALERLQPGTGRLPMVSSVSGSLVETGQLGADYWWRNVRQTVLFASAIETVLDMGHRLFLEVGPHAVLTPALRACAEARQQSIRAVASLAREVDQQQAVLQALGSLWEAGAAPCWPKILGEGPRLRLPAYPWDRQTYRSAARDRQRNLFAQQPYPLLGRSRDATQGCWEGVADARTHPFLNQHRLDEAPLLSASTVLELALEAGLADQPASGFEVCDLRLVESCFLEAERPVPLRSSLSSRGEGEWQLHRLAGDQSWQLLAQARLRPGVSGCRSRPVESARRRPWPPGQVEQGASRWGFDYGPFFQRVEACYALPGQALGLQLQWPEQGAEFVLHPGALDVGIRALLCLSDPLAGQRALPSRIERFRLFRVPQGRVWIEAELRGQGPRHWDSRVGCWDEQGLCWEMDGLIWSLLMAGDCGHEGLLDLQWTALAAAEASPGVALEGPGASRLQGLLPSGTEWRLFVADETDPLPLMEQLLGWVQQESPQRWGLVTFEGLQQSALRGFWRALQLEFPSRQPRLIDLPQNPQPADLALLGAALSVPEERELRIRQGQMERGRWQRIEWDQLPVHFPQATAMQAVPCPQGGLQRPMWRARPAPSPGPGEVLLEVQAWGLNFSDVLKSLGLYPLWGRSPTLGLECAGKVMACGPGVSEPQPGQAVVALATGVLGNPVCVPAELCAPWPEHWSAAEAASRPLVVMTAWAALHELARLQPGESLLVHSASGGVGLAALHLGRQLGARLLATAGSPERRQYLKGFGVERVYDSRSLDFVSQVLQDTGGRGVEVVLNSLSGPALEAGLECLAEGGRWIELGKRDFDERRCLSLGAFRRGIGFLSLDLEARILHHSARLGECLRRVLPDSVALPFSSWPAARLPEALLQMASRAHLGKLVVVNDDRPPLLPPQPQRPRLNPDKGYLISGGLSGLGAALARQLVLWGARHLWLAGRRGPATPGAEALRDELQALGARVELLQLDVTAVEAPWPEHEVPLGGVFHAANHMEDRVLSQLDAATLGRVYRAKAEGAWRLHLATLGQPLEHFVLFGSISGAFGAAGQAPYCAANAYLEGLAGWRRQQGLPALLVHWGPVAEAGYLQQHPEVLHHLRQRGHRPLQVDHCLVMLGRLLQLAPWLTRYPAVCQADWPLLAPHSPQLRELVQGAEATPGDSEAEPATALDFLVQQARRILRLQSPESHLNRSLRELGLDSLLAVEFRNAIERRFQIALPMQRVLRGPSLQELAEEIDGRRLSSSPPPEVLPHLSDDEVGDLLRQLEG